MADNKLDKNNALSFTSPSAIDLEKRNFLITATACTGAVGAIVTAIVPFGSSMLPSERAKAAGAPVEVDISKIQPGRPIGKPDASGYSAAEEEKFMPNNEPIRR